MKIFTQEEKRLRDVCKRPAVKISFTTDFDFGRVFCVLMGTFLLFWEENGCYVT